MKFQDFFVPTVVTAMVLAYVFKAKALKILHSLIALL